jgi:hypothetical protein
MVATQASGELAKHAKQLCWATNGHDSPASYLISHRSPVASEGSIAVAGVVGLGGTSVIHTRVNSTTAVSPCMGLVVAHRGWVQVDLNCME